jgi:hypothetical protein
MSIIHDALKKLQQGQTPKADNTPLPSATAQPSTYLYSTPTEPLVEHKTTETRSPMPNQIKSALALLCALVIIIGSFAFFYKQLNTYFPTTQRWVQQSFDKLIHKTKFFNFNTKAPELIPLAKLTVTPPVPVIKAPITSNTVPPIVPATLNIHGVMSNGTSNLVLINDQVYQEGDDVDGIKIVKISLNSITVIDNGKEKEIRVKN